MCKMEKGKTHMEEWKKIQKKYKIRELVELMSH